MHLAHNRAVEYQPSGGPDFPCAGSNPLDTLHAHGVSRFAKRVAHLATRLETASGTGACDQIAWEEIAIALGYGGNEAQMEPYTQIPPSCGSDKYTRYSDEEISLTRGPRRIFLAPEDS